jgi:hypothetical protein
MEALFVPITRLRTTYGDEVILGAGYSVEDLVYLDYNWEDMLLLAEWEI